MDQKGFVFKAGNWWWLKYRDTVFQNGSLQRKQVNYKLAPVEPEDRKLKRPPLSVLDLAKDFLRPLNQHKLTPESTQSLANFVEKVYFPYAKQQKRASTFFTDSNRWEKHLKPRCESIRLRDFRTVTGEHFIADIARMNDLSRTTLKQLKSLLSAIFKHAKRQGFIDGENPMRDVSIPKARKSAPTRAYSLDEVNRMLAALPEPAATVVCVAAFAGLRRSEIQGLDWTNYDGLALKVERSVWEGHVNDPKTDASAAPVPVISTLRKRLDNYRVMCGNPLKGPMFAAENQKPLRLNNLLHRQILPVLSRAQVSWAGWHAFRRGLATNLHDLGIDDLTIKAILRHSNVAVTQQSYIKTLPKQSVAALNVLDAELLKNRSKDESVDSGVSIN